MAGYRGLLLAGTMMAAFAITDVAMAQAMTAEREISYAIAPQDLSSALSQFAQVSGVQLIYDTKVTADKVAPGVTGVMSRQDVLSRLLAGSGLTFQFSGDRAVIITAQSTTLGGGGGDGVRSVGVVNVEGASGATPFGEMVSPINGVNGSRDVQATEGTGSYTTGAVSIASKIPQTLRETPASISVVTAQQIQDQGLITPRDVLEKITGVTVTTSGNTEEFEFSSRGFTITSMTIDGGAPLLTGINNRPVIDMSEFDSVQLIRGADGLFGGYGDPGGSINLVRKKPLDHNQILYDQAIGSWSNFREQFDITGPLNADKSLRGRFVAARTDRDYFYDVSEGHKSSIYGVVDYDLTPNTLLTLGANYVQERNIPNNGGLPRYSTGAAIDFSTSTCFCVPWSYDDIDRTEAFVTLDHQFNKDWSSRLNVTYNDQEAEALYYTSTTSIYPTDTVASGGISGYWTKNPVEQIAVDFSTNGKFSVLGREQSLVFGASYQSISNAGGETQFYPGFTIPDIFNFDPNAYPQPPKPTTESEYTVLKGRYEIWGAYANLKAEVVKNLHATLGLRWNSYLDSISTLQDADFDSSTPNSIVLIPKLRERGFQKPTVGLTYDFRDNFTVYGTYQSIYRPNTVDYARGATTGEKPPAITGFNEEVGLKWESPSKRMNASLSGYRIEQNGFVSSDYATGQLVPLVRDITSQGVDFEVAGEVVPGLQVSIGYTYNDNKSTETAYGSTRVQPKSSYTPHHLLKTWATYRPSTGRFSRFILGGGMNWQSSAYWGGYTCPDAAPRTDGTYCTYVPYEYTTAAYASFSARIGYKLTDHLEIGLNGDNLSNVKTYGSNPNQAIYAYNYYIEPINFMVSLRAKW